MKKDEMLIIPAGIQRNKAGFFEVKKSPSREMKVMLGVKEDDSNENQDDNPGFFKTGNGKHSKEILVMLGIK